MSTFSPIKVMLVDDSLLVRGLLRRIIETDPVFKIISTASDGATAIKDYQTFRPDIVVLDIEMPVMDGLTALSEILAIDSEARIIICSSLTQKGAQTTLEALQRGAVDYLSKPSSQTIDRTISFEEELLMKLRALNKRAKEIPSLAAHIASSNQSDKESDSVQKPVFKPVLRQETKDISLKKLPELTGQFPVVLAIGSSTGGPKALTEFFKNLDKKIMIPILVTQHIPVGFTKLLAESIEKASGFKTYEAEDGMIIEPGHIYIAPGQKHMCIGKGVPKRIVLSDEPPVNFCKPAIDVMLDSLSDIYKNNILTVLLTGMGTDGKMACQRLAEQSPSNVFLAQDEASSVVWGIPGSVAKEGLCYAVAPLEELADITNKLIKQSVQS